MSSLSQLVAPFRAERYASAGRLTSLIAPPYDVISSERRAALAERDRYNIVHLIVPEGRGDKYAAAAKLLDTWRKDGVIERDPAPCAYVIQQRFDTPDGGSHARTGVIAGLQVEPYERGRVKPHERTHAGPKEDRLALSRATSAMLESIFVLAPDKRGHLQRRLDGVTRHAPTATATLDGVGVGLWKVGGAQGQEVVRAVNEDAVYIADGHHRYETANAYRAENPAAERIPALIVPIGDPGLVVLPTHRLIGGGAVDGKAAHKALGKATVEPVDGEEELSARLAGMSGASCVVLLPDGGRLAVSAGPADDGEVEIATVERLVIDPIRQTMGGKAAITYSASMDAVQEAVGTGSVGVLVNPTPVERVLSVSDAGGIMPPKSTYFAPKVPSGLVFMPYDE